MSYSLQAHLRLGVEECCSFPLPVAPLPDSSSLQQDYRRSTHCSAACAWASVLPSWSRAPVALAAAAGCRFFSLFAPTAVRLCTRAT